MDKLKDSRRFNFTMVENDLIDSEEQLTIYEKMVYIILCRFAKDEKCFPSLATIAKKAGCSKRKTQDAINSLIDKGLIVKQSRKRNTGGQTSNLYVIRGVAQDAMGGSTGCHGGVAQDATHEQDLYINKTISIKSVSLEEDQRRTDGRTDNNKKEIESILDRINISLFQDDSRKAITTAIKALWHKPWMEIQGTRYEQQQIRNMLQDLTLESIDHAIFKLRQQHEKKPIANKAKYLQACIVTASIESPADNCL